MPARLQQQGVMAPMSKCQSPDVDPPLLLHENGVPERGRVVGCVDPVPWHLRPVRAGEASPVKLRERCHLTGAGVDEESPHE